MAEVSRAHLNNASEYIRPKLADGGLRYEYEPHIMQAMAQLAIAEQLHNIAKALDDISLCLFKK